ncbi:hypothetical protein BLOT_009967 [Blomia tropicalis]|nr:hypothetical protein BLOT_009967 [Blomia tropicalis]
MKNVDDDFDVDVDVDDVMPLMNSSFHVQDDLSHSSLASFKLLFRSGDGETIPHDFVSSKLKQSESIDNSDWCSRRSKCHVITKRFVVTNNNNNNYNDNLACGMEFAHLPSYLRLIRLFYVRFFLTLY